MLSERIRAFQEIVESYPYAVYRVGACQLFPCDNPDASRFRHHETSLYFASTFRIVAESLSCELSRFDLHHAHFFYSSRFKTFGLLFHAREYPAYTERFPYNLGYCQRGSDLVIRKGEMRYRNVVWLYGDGLDTSYITAHLLFLDAQQRMPIGTCYETEFGEHLGDLYFFQSRFGEKENGLNRGVHVVLF